MTRRVVQTFAEWRTAARDLVARQIAPEYVEWASEPEDGDLFSGFGAQAGAPSSTPALPAGVELRLPRQLLDMIEDAACFNALDRWSFL